MKYLIQNEDISIRKMEDDMQDYNLMTTWLSTKELLDYYEGRSNSFDLEKVIKKFAPRVKGDEEVVPCIIELHKKAIGYIQYYRIEPDEYGVEETINLKNHKFPYGVDLFIGEADNWSKGIGTITVRLLITYLFKNENADIIFIDPQTWNKRAIRCYEKSGFTPMTVLKGSEIHDGEFKNSLIMTISIEDWKNNKIRAK